jgi:DNA polymerase-3 subunit delta
MKPEEFIQSLSSQAPPIVVCVGEEKFFKEEVLRAVREFLARDTPNYSYHPITLDPADSGPAAAQRLLGALRTPNLFSPVTLFAVRMGETVLPHLAAELAEFMDSKSTRSNRVVFFSNALDGRTRLAKRLKKAGGLVECKKLFTTPGFWQRGASVDTELSRWTQRRAADMGLGLDAQAAYFLSSLTGNDLFRLASELEKLSLALPGGKGRVTVQEIENTTGMSAVHTPFDIWDKIEAGDASGALETLDVVLRNGLRSASGKLETDGASIAAILLGLFRERVRLSAQVALLVWEKKPEKQIMERLKIRSAFYFRKLKESAGRLTADKLSRMNRALLSAERRIKRAGHSATPVLEETVVQLTGMGV